jgi:sugar phosphate isomerase/epimerase
MKLGISELAWESDLKILDILEESNIQYIEAVIPKHVNWNRVDLTQFKRYIDQLKLRNINVLSTQSITYNSNIDSFLDINFYQHMKLISEICSTVNINTIVLGAPALRKNYNHQMLSDVFTSIDILFRNKNQILLIEPNSKQYNGQYFFTVNEIVNFIKTNKFTNIKTMIDTHNVLNEKQNLVEVYMEHKSYINHIHVSENNLSSFIKSQNHIELSTALHDTNYNGLVIYECIKSPTLFGDVKLFSNIYNK